MSVLREYVRFRTIPWKCRQSCFAVYPSSLSRQKRSKTNAIKDAVSPAKRAMRARGKAHVSPPHLQIGGKAMSQLFNSPQFRNQILAKLSLEDLELLRPDLR